MTDHARCHEIEIDLRNRLKEAEAFTLSERWDQQRAEIDRLRAALKKVRNMIYSEKLEVLRMMKSNPVLEIDATLATSKQELKPATARPELEEALRRGRERWDAMDWEEQEAELREQQKSWARQDKD